MKELVGVITSINYCVCGVICLGSTDETVLRLESMNSGVGVVLVDDLIAYRLG